MGAVRPEDGYLFAVIASHGNARVFQLFIDVLHEHMDLCKRNILILDNARFHHAKAIKWGKIEPLFLPGYSPELNPIEELWLQAKKEFFNKWTPDSEEEQRERVAEAIDFFQNRSDAVKSICATTKYL